MKFLLFTLVTRAVTTLSLFDPVRASEDYATLDNLADGRLELIIGKGNGPAQARIRHGSATSRESVELAARHGDPLLSADVTNPIEPSAELVRHYRQRWAHYGRDPADALVGAGTVGFHVAATSQQARAVSTPLFEARRALARKLGLPLVFDTIDDFLARSSALVGSPPEVIDKVGRYHEQLGHEVIHLSAERDGRADTDYLGSLELFQAEVAPELRRRIPSRPLAAGREFSGVTP
ncbi:LLM class flavin-dependent oxidoreductase [Nocardia canadensis]|uniref:LLM class flavin-dependent oxidoreductase n=1 Tax=Nocardia canadensis TaxID=3065238 RepID=UPI002930CC83|nr:LLM class flavin-dependent oxidoreductase [Nocardia canadensis]